MYPNNIKHFNSNNTYSEDDFEFNQSKRPTAGFLGAILGSIPGALLCAYLIYATPLAGLSAVIIIPGSLWGFKYFGKYMTYKVKNLIVVYSTLVMLILTTAIISYTLYVQYNRDVLNEKSITELRESFVTNLKNNGKSEQETETMLKNEYGIQGFNDIEGLNNLVKKTLADSYKKSHKVKNVPDTPTNAVICLYQSLAYNTTISKPFSFNILSCAIISIMMSNILLAYVKYLKPREEI